MPLSPSQIVYGKFFGSFLIVLLSLMPTIIYAVSLQALSAVGGLDIGSTIGSYLGLLMLGAVFTSIGICTSSFTNNTVVAFISGAFVCFLLYTGFEAISKLPVFVSGLDYYIEMLGIKFHYKSISKGVIDIRDVIYFTGVIFIFLFITERNVANR